MLFRAYQNILNFQQYGEEWKIVVSLHHIKLEKKLVWWGCSSCSTNTDIVQKFLRKGSTKVIFNIHTDQGVDLSPFSSFPNENEILIPPGAYVEIINKSVIDSLTLVELKQIPGPFIKVPPKAMLPKSVPPKTVLPKPVLALQPGLVKPPAQKIAVALFNFPPENERELALKVGDVITVLEEVNEWWFGTLSDGRKGYFPAHYVELKV